MFLNRQGLPYEEKLGEEAMSESLAAKEEKAGTAETTPKSRQNRRRNPRWLGSGICCGVRGRTCSRHPVRRRKLLWIRGSYGSICSSFPAAYVLATAGSVYFVGRIGKQTGSLPATLGGVFLGVPTTVLMYLCIGAAEYMMWEIEKMVLWPLVFLAPATMATLGFNLTRRYRESP